MLMVEHLLNFTGMQDTNYTIGVSDYQVQLTFNFGQDSTFVGQETAGGNTDRNGKGDFHGLYHLLILIILRMFS